MSAQISVVRADTWNSLASIWRRGSSGVACVAVIVPARSVGKNQGRDGSSHLSETLFAVLCTTPPSRFLVLGTRYSLFVRMRIAYMRSGINGRHTNSSPLALSPPRLIYVVVA